MQALAEKIIQRWGDRAEADDARGILLDLALGEGRLEKAEQYLQEISAASPRRGEAELNLGQALWQRAQHLLRTSTLEHDHAAEAEKIIARAAGLLGDGIARCRKAGRERHGHGGRSEPTYHRSLPAAMLALAQIHMTEGRPAEAIALLEDPSIAAAGDSDSLALLAYVATGQLDKAKTLLPDASNVASACRQRRCRAANAADLPADPSSLEAVSGGLSRSAAGRTGARKSCRGSTTFLASPAQGPAAGSFFVLAWRAEAYAGLAEGLDVWRPGRAAGSRKAISAGGCRFPGDPAPRGEAKPTSRRRPRSPSPCGSSWPAAFAACRTIRRP